MGPTDVRFRGSPTFSALVLFGACPRFKIPGAEAASDGDGERKTRCRPHTHKKIGRRGEGRNKPAASAACRSQRFYMYCSRLFIVIYTVVLIAPPPPPDTHTHTGHH